MLAGMKAWIAIAAALFAVSAAAAETDEKARKEPKDEAKESDKPEKPRKPSGVAELPAPGYAKRLRDAVEAEKVDAGGVKVKVAVVPDAYRYLMASAYDELREAGYSRWELEKRTAARSSGRTSGSSRGSTRRSARSRARAGRTRPSPSSRCGSSPASGRYPSRPRASRSS